MWRLRAALRCRDAGYCRCEITLALAETRIGEALSLPIRGTPHADALAGLISCRQIRTARRFGALLSGQGH